MSLQVPPFDRVRLLVVGDILLDRYCQGGATRISPEAPVPVVRVDSVTDRPGGAGNVAMNLAALGAGVRLAGGTGDDAGADNLQAMLEAAGVDCRFQRRAGSATITKLRVIARQQQLLRLDFEESAPLAAAPAWDAASLLSDCDALVLSDYAKGALADPAALLAGARERGLPVLVDPGGADFMRWRGATLLTPNRAEFEACVGHCADDAQLVGRGRRLLDELSLQALLVTRGEQGMTLLRAGQEEATHFPARAREVFDVTGAGDTVIAVIAAALAAGAGLDDAVALANTAAGLVVGRLGAAAVSAPELARALGDEPPPGRGVLALEPLRAALQACRRRGEKVVFTNGCFDLLHAGHVACLEQARACGDRLVVAVNSDASVRRLKGEGRPVNPLQRRMAVLAGLQAVDWVVSFDADTPEALLRELRPDVLAKGGDYRDLDAVVGRDIVESYGGRVLLTGQVENLSSSAMLRDIREPSKH
ncbi:MAG: bifunctional heptose 7-phosphate kinase/heptose 1-phosphate adenyltransferase [Halioglobus sp.]|nr:bifunctional heptose 7-phosphate kinase/heptose 1-phosphate adenyltransferase [Halioglobus sp.]